jgi:metal-dependent amidase/aminoacylase/carboxypeptidase family protein
MTARQPDLVKLRRDLHAHPEIGLHLPRTQQKVLEALSDLDLEISLGRELSSVTAVLRGGRPGPAVLLRADMDALPVSELTGVEYASGIEGAMHACGHDLHTAMLVGAARILAGHRAGLAGDVVLMFQPGEEGWDGAARMIAEGVLDAAGERVRAAYGLHVRAQGSSSGRFQGRSGPIMGGSDPFEVREELGDERFDPLTGPVPAGEDFVRVLAEVPGCFLLLDASVGGDPVANHSPYAVFDDGVLSDGALVLASLASRSLGSADLR